MSEHNNSLEDTGQEKKVKNTKKIISKQKKSKPLTKENRNSEFLRKQLKEELLKVKTDEQLLLLAGGYSVWLALEVGLNSAIVYNKLNYYLDQNRINKVGFKDGYYWSYFSIKQFSQYIYVLTEKQIRVAFKKLEKEGYIVSKKLFWKDKGDQRLSYRITEKSILPTEKKHLPYRENDTCPTGKISDISIQINNKKEIKEETFSLQIENNPIDQKINTPNVQQPVQQTAKQPISKDPSISINDYYSYLAENNIKLVKTWDDENYINKNIYNGTINYHEGIPQYISKAKESAEKFMFIKQFDFDRLLEEKTINRDEHFHLTNTTFEFNQILRKQITINNAYLKLKKSGFRPTKQVNSIKSQDESKKCVEMQNNAKKQYIKRQVDDYISYYVKNYQKQPTKQELSDFIKGVEDGY